MRAITENEFDDALRMAEALLRQADEWRNAINRYRAALIYALAASITLVVLALVLGSVRGAASIIVVLLTLVASVVAAWTTWGRLITPLREMVRRDERFAVETVNTLRELLPFLAEQEHWSFFRTERTTLRISRFPIKTRTP